jgi:hypothetical protein
VHPSRLATEIVVGTVALTAIAAIILAASGKWSAAIFVFVVVSFGLVAVGLGRPIRSSVDVDAGGIRLRNAGEAERFVPWSEVDAMDVSVSRMFRPYRVGLTTMAGERVRIRAIQSLATGGVRAGVKVLRWLQSSPEGLDVTETSFGLNPSVRARFVSAPGWLGRELWESTQASGS